MIEKTKNTKKVSVGRLSDGSDRMEISISTWKVKVKDGYRTFELSFDHDPTDDEIAEKYSAGNFDEVTATDDVIKGLEEQISTMAIAMAELMGGVMEE